MVLAILAGASVAALATAIVTYYTRPPTVRGAVIKDDSDFKRQSPITDVEVSIAEDAKVAPVRSDFSGYFKLTLPRGTLPGRPITLQFRHPDYKPVDLKATLSDKIYVAHMVPLFQPDTLPRPNRPKTTVANVFVRYAIETSRMTNIGTGVKTFQVVNTGNVRCDHHSPCSPDGRWKAAIGGASLDAGEGNEYQDARLSCIAGPCPFAKIVNDNFSKGGRYISVSVLGWSDTTTFLLQAEVFRREVSDIVRQSYPVIYGQAINFTLPGAAEGPSLEAEIDGVNMVFPLGPSPELSWADCNVRMGKDHSKTYRCELRAQFRFK